MQTYYLFLALDLARQRSAEADRARLAGLANAGRSDVGPLRRLVARTAIAIARAADDRAVAPRRANPPQRAAAPH
jgi:hypothetical protein